MAGVSFIQECDERSECQNSVTLLGFGSGRCGICRLSPNGPEKGTIYWRPKTVGMKHPTLVQIKKDEKVAKQAETLEKKRGANKAKQALLTKAARAEKTTERNIIHGTKNSGRVNKDGDHVVVNEITLDTKLQTTRDNPVVFLHEIVKVGLDAKRVGKAMGALMLRNKHGVGIVAMTEADFAWLIGRIG